MIKKQVIICPPTKHSIHQINKHLKGDTDFQWGYFGKDVSKAISIEQQLGNKGQRIKIAEKLQESARLFRQPSIDYIGKLILKEFKKRGIETHPEKMKDCSRKFLMQLDNSSSTVGMIPDKSEEGIYLVSPHAEWIANKEKSLQDFYISYPNPVLATVVTHL